MITAGHHHPLHPATRGHDWPRRGLCARRRVRTRTRVRVRVPAGRPRRRRIESQCALAIVWLINLRCDCVRFPHAFKSLQKLWSRHMTRSNNNQAASAIDHYPMWRVRTMNNRDPGDTDTAVDIASLCASDERRLDPGVTVSRCSAYPSPVNSNESVTSHQQIRIFFISTQISTGGNDDAGAVRPS